MGQSCGGETGVGATKQNTVEDKVYPLLLMVPQSLVSRAPAGCQHSWHAIESILFTVGAAQVYFPSCGRLKYHISYFVHEFSAPELEEFRLQFPSLNSQIVYNNSVIAMKGLITRVPVSMSPRIPHFMTLLLEPLVTTH